jgi:hypothetical protein
MMMSCILYASVVGSLMYVMVCTISNISHVVGVVSRNMVLQGKSLYG